MILVEESKLIFASLESLIRQLSQMEFCKPLSILNQSSISQHVRHILEFYQEFLLGLQRGEIDFDARKRSSQLEEDKEFALEFLTLLQKEMLGIIKDHPIAIRVSTHEKEVRPLLTSSSFRELAYCNEHSIHHMAILKIALNHSFPNVIVSEGFGIAFSTQHVNQLAVTC
ncbi:DinB family protein [Leptospira ognonensis]|uniref:DinB family protein n=1 Tax=Leptospira ognonensis TaxID=2484945 RepID=A0A4R9K0B2_9LEPT|nr:DinB family protein [Leptospira ognonensis]TGL59082.1 DinB family protein [Leptospira ognonensis]